MAFWVKQHSAGDVTVLKCSGRIVEGPGSQLLQQHVDDAMGESAFVVLDLSEIEFIDSSGLGLLVRLLNRTRAASGDLKLCAVSSKVATVLQVTRLTKVLETYDTESEAIASFGRRAGAAGPQFRSPAILCVDKSADVLAYIRELLRQAGYEAVTASNVPDALTLLQATQPKIVVIGAGVHGQPATRAVEAFKKLASARTVINLPQNFSFDDAAAVGRELVEQIKKEIPA
jgi:anti-sigma B factor antagonist